MAAFEMVKYHAQEYPSDIPLRIEECAAHMDVTVIRSKLKRSMHTEYSYGKRKFDSRIIAAFPELIVAQKNGVPQLWRSAEWGKQFVKFIAVLAGGEAPTVIEVHPPFTDYASWDGFLESYMAFEEAILGRFPDIEILIENRCGSVYKGGRFLISKLQDLEILCERIEKKGLHLKIAYDVPQIFTAHNVKTQITYTELLQKTREFRAFIGGVHLWGKKRAESGRLVAHCGDLNSYFSEEAETKAMFLQEFAACFDDGICRKMVLEVNSGNEDLNSIITDLISAGVVFI